MVLKTASWMDVRFRRLREFLHHWGLIWDWKWCGDEMLLATIHVPIEWGVVYPPRRVDGAPREGERTWLIEGEEINSRDIAQVGDVEGMTGHRCRAKRRIRRDRGHKPDRDYWFNSPDELTQGGKGR